MARQRSYYVRGELLFELREDAHLTQVELGRKVGVSEVSVRNWERGKAIHWKNAVRLGKVLKFDPEKLVTRTPPLGLPTEPAADEDVEDQSTREMEEAENSADVEDEDEPGSAEGSGS